MWSAENLNQITYQLDVSIYWPNGDPVVIENMKHQISLVIERPFIKGPEFVQLIGTEVEVASRMKAIEGREGRHKVIYHFTNVTIYEGALVVQIKTETESGHNNNTNLVMMARHGKMPILTQCDMVQVVRDFNDLGDGFKEWFIDKVCLLRFK